jgi:hypothetical protein
MARNRRSRKADSDPKASVFMLKVALTYLARVNGVPIVFVLRVAPQTNATLIPTPIRPDAIDDNHFRSHPPFNTWCVEQGLVLHSEFRDGSVPAGHERLRVPKQALTDLPKGVLKVRLSGDSATLGSSC